MDSFRYLGDVISCVGGVKSAVRDRISCAWCTEMEGIGELASKPKHSTGGKSKGLLCMCETCIAVS